jgi:two-component system, LytTR family, sensor histidine kinase AlgZ
LIGHAIFILCSIALTHLFRRALQERRTLDEPIATLWPFLLRGAFGISLVQAALVIGTSIVLTGGHWGATAVVALWWGMFLATGVWTILYVRFAEHRQHTHRERQLQQTLREAELLALEAQLNPHFLFNSLNSIRALVAVEPLRAQEMLTRLANVLRSTLDRHRLHTVSLASELESVSDYLALETVRFQDRLRTEVDIDPAASTCFVPPLLVQTLVENAIKHGVAHVTGSGEVIVRARRIGETVSVDIENTGSLPAPAVPRRDGMVGHQLGLVNARERLRLLYGERASLSLAERRGRVVATVQIPVSA